MKKIAIVTGGYFPLPATKGGAVECLDENLIRVNERTESTLFLVFSIYEKKAEILAREYKYTQFQFIKIPFMIQLIDKCIYKLFKYIFKKEKHVSYRYILQRIFYIFMTAKKLHRSDLDCIILENHTTLFWVIKLFGNKKIYKDKYYYHLHNLVISDFGCSKEIADCKKVFTVSDYICREFEKYLGSEKKDYSRCYVLKNKIDRNSFLYDMTDKEKHHIKKGFGISDQQKVILFTGRLCKEKGIIELLKAFERIQTPDAMLLIVGSYYFGSDMKNDFGKEMDELLHVLKNHVKFTGFINYKDMPKIYAIADIVVLPSIWDDPAPLTVIEALSGGKALITTNSGGIPEYVDEMTVLLDRDHKLIENLAKYIDQILADDNYRAKMEQCAISHTKDWTIEKYYEEFMELINLEL